MKDTWHCDEIKCGNIYKKEVLLIVKTSVVIAQFYSKFFTIYFDIKLVVVDTTAARALYIVGQ